MKTLHLFSPAKINLFLRILRKRDDGYHDLASLFQAIKLGDTLSFSFADEDEITSNHPDLPNDHRNLITKALHLFRLKTGCRRFFKIHCNKKIPIGAGLGGGSSNAATTLYGLNQLMGSHVIEKELQEWSLNLGSDVPFFFSSGSAFCTGRGERVDSLAPLKQVWTLWLIVPAWGMSTPAVYGKLDLANCSKEHPIDIKGRITSGEMAFINDLERPAFEIEPKLVELQKKLKEQGLNKVILTGSGSGFILYSENPPKLSSDVISIPISFCNRSKAWYEEL